MAGEDLEELQEETWWWDRPGSRHVTTMKLEETVTLEKHGAVARFSLWKFSASLPPCR